MHSIDVTHTPSAMSAAKLTAMRLIGISLLTCGRRAPSRRIARSSMIGRDHGIEKRQPLPEVARGAPRALSHAGELGPHDVWDDGGLTHPRAEAAVRARDDVLATDQSRVATDALGDQIGVFDEVGRG